MSSKADVEDTAQFSSFHTSLANGLASNHVKFIHFSALAFFTLGETGEDGLASQALRKRVKAYLASSPAPRQLITDTSFHVQLLPILAQEFCGTALTEDHVRRIVDAVRASMPVPRGQGSSSSRVVVVVVVVVVVGNAASRRLRVGPVGLLCQRPTIL